MRGHGIEHGHGLAVQINDLRAGLAVRKHEPWRLHPFPAQSRDLAAPSAGVNEQADHLHGHRLAILEGAQGVGKSLELAGTEEPVHLRALVARGSFAGIGTARAQTKLFGIAHHDRHDGNGPVEGPRALGAAVAPTQDVGTPDSIDRLGAELLYESFENVGMVALLGSWLPVTRIVVPETRGVITEQDQGIWTTRGTPRDGQAIERNLGELGPRHLARRVGCHLPGSPQRDPFLLAALPELDNPGLRSARKRAQAKARQLRIPPEEFLNPDTTTGNVAVEVHARAGFGMITVTGPIRGPNLGARLRYQMAI